MKPTYKNSFWLDVIKEASVPVDENRSRKLGKLIALVVVNILVVAALWAYFELQRPTKANLQLNDFSWSNHSPDSSFNTSYVSVQGTICNIGPGTANNVNLIIDVYVDYQCGHHMDAMIEKEILSIGSIAENCSKEFRFDVPYSANSTLPYFLKSVKHDLVWTN